MIEPKQKKCKGQNKAFGFEGCGKLTLFRKHGLCASCLADWVDSTENGKTFLKSIQIKGIKRIEANNKKERTAEKRMVNVGGAMRLADTYFSRFVRLFHSSDGQCTCYTCGSITDIKNVDNGHYMKRKHKATRYHENNCRPQCKTCNGDTKHNGKQAEFRVNLSYEIGEENVVNIESLSKQTIDANTNFFKNISDTYREKVNELQKELKVKYW